MEVVRDLALMQQNASRLRREGKRIGLVPTMGYLHEGHANLVRGVKPRCDVTVVSLFVNPTQFSPDEDFKKYPRDLERDSKICTSVKVDFLFLPDVADMYPQGFSTSVVEESLSRHLEGASRPSHFRGVCTVVAKLFHIVQPEVAIFGQKDAQQALVIKRMVRDLNFPVEILVAPISRDKDGLALSSRNEYLGPGERKQALTLYTALDWALQQYRQGRKEAAELRKGMLKIILYSPQAKVDYIEFVNSETLDPVPAVKKGTLILVAVRIGKTRLIDNVVIE